jgi:hypothetical protein
MRLSSCTADGLFVIFQSGVSFNTNLKQPSIYKAVCARLCKAAESGWWIKQRTNAADIKVRP